MSWEFDVEAEVANIIHWIQKYFVNNGPGAPAVIGISGGKDSTVAAKLCTLALGPDRVIGIQMPQHEQSDIDVSDAVIKWLGIKSFKINIGEICDVSYKALIEAVPVANLNGSLSSRITTNHPARMRMAMLYDVAALCGGRVVNTCNRSEDYVGYSTKYGDGAGDFSPLGSYTVREVLLIGEYLGVPDEFLYKAPSDGMCGKTDEENLGFTYTALDQYLLEDIYPPAEVLENIEDRHKRNCHKLRYMPVCPKKPHSDWCF